MSQLEKIPNYFRAQYQDDLSMPVYRMKICSPNHPVRTMSAPMICPHVRYLAHVFDCRIQDQLAKASPEDRAELLKEINDPLTVLLFYTLDSEGNSTVEAYRTILGWVIRN